MRSGPNCMDQVRSSCCTRPTGSPLRDALTYNRSPFHLISPLLRTLRTVTAAPYSGELIRARIGPERGRVQQTRRSLSQGLVRPFVVVAVPEAVEGSPLSSPVGLWRSSRILVQCSVKSLKASILFGMSGLDPLWDYPKLDPPCGQRRKASQAHTGEGRAVVGADDPWKAVLPEGALQGALDLRAGRPLQTVACQQVTGHRILGSQGIDALSVSSAEPALQVNGPHVVRVLGVGKGLAPACSPTPSLAPPHQTRTTQNAARRAGGRPGHVGLNGTQPGHDLLRAPCGALALRLNDALSHLSGGGVGMMMRSSAQF